MLLADAMTLFLEHENLHALYGIADQELLEINGWFISNKPSFNFRKIKFIIFYMPNKRDDIPLMLPKLQRNNQSIERAEPIRFGGVLLSKCLSWKSHTKCIENKFSKEYWFTVQSKGIFGSKL